MDAESSVHAEPAAGTSGPVRVPPNVVDITPDGDSGSISAGTGKAAGGPPSGLAVGPASGLAVGPPSGLAVGRPAAWPSARRRRSMT